MGPLRAAAVVLLAALIASGCAKESAKRTDVAAPGRQAALDPQIDPAPGGPTPSVPDGAEPLDDPLSCLARTVYHEARSEGDEAMRAVAHVVRNRTKAARFPDTVCDVVKEGGESGGCQFSWWCDGRSDEARNASVYARAIDVAREVLDGASDDPTGGATMFHNTSVDPSWAGRARKTAQIGSHIFYRLN